MSAGPGYTGPCAYGNRLRWLLTAAGMLVLLILYLPALSAPAVFDDVPQFAHVRTLTGFRAWLGKDCFHLWRPVKNLCFVLFDRLASDRPWVWHLSSLLLLELCFVAAVRYFCVLFRHGHWAVGAAVLWGTAPTMVSAGVWPSCINLLFMALAALGSLLLHEAGFSAGSRAHAVCRGLAAGACLFAALVSYEAAVAVLPLVVLHDALVDARRLRLPRAYARYVWLAAVTGLYLWVRHMAGGSMRMSNDAMVPLPPLLLSASSAHFAMDHLGLWFWPFGRQYVLATFNVHAPGTVWRLVGAWLAAGALAVLAWTVFRRRPYVAGGLAWFALAFAPLSNVLPLFSGPYADYYLVLPGLGLSYLVVCLARDESRVLRMRSRSRSRRAVAAGVLAVVGVWALARIATTARWVPRWTSGMELLERSVANRPEAFRARAGLARLKAEAGEVKAAERHARLSVEQAPAYLHGYYALCDALQRQGRLEEAAAAIRKARRLAPDAVAPVVLEAFIRGSMPGEGDRSEQLYREALDLPWDPEYSRIAALNLGERYFVSGRLEQAVAVWERAARRMPRAAEFHQNLAFGYLKTGRPDLARAHAREAEQLGSPVHPDVRAMLRQAADGAPVATRD